MPLSESERTICEAIASRADVMYRRLQEAVAIPTGGDFVEGLDHYRSMMKERFDRIGAQSEFRSGMPPPNWLRPSHSPSGVRRYAGAHHSESDAARAAPAVPVHPILVARSSTGDGAPTPDRILLVGHLDTVHDPHGDFRTLTELPDETRATGPGAVDMKGGIECAMTALEIIAAHGIDLCWTFVLNSDEETGSFQSAHILRVEAAAHQWGIVLEPALADGSLAIERMGSGQFMIEVFGRAAHAGREFEKGISAVTGLAEILLALAKMSSPEQGRIVNVGPLVGGKATNVVPDYAACWGNVRYATPEAGVRLGEMIDALGRDRQDGRRVVVHRRWNRPAKPLIPQVERLANLARDVAKDLGRNLPFSKTGGVCDGNILQDAGLPTLDTLGVRGGNLHRTDEFIEIPSLVERAQLLAVLMLRLGRRRDSDLRE